MGLDEEGRIASQVSFDLDDIDAAIAELDVQARFEEQRSQARQLENAASRVDQRFNEFFADRCWDEIGGLLTDDIRLDDRRQGLRREGNNRATELSELRAIADLGTRNMTSDVVAIRGERLALVRTLYTGRDQRPEPFHTEVLRIAEIDADERIVAHIVFDSDDFDAAIAELDARYLAGEAAAVRAHVVGDHEEPMPHSTGANCLRRRQTGSTSTIGGERHLRPAKCWHYIGAVWTSHSLT